MDIYNNREDALQFCNEIIGKMLMLLNEMDRVGDLPCLNDEERKSDDDLTFGELWKEITRDIRALHEILKASVLVYLSLDTDSTENMKEVAGLFENIASVIRDNPEFSRDDVLESLDEMANLAKESMEEESDDEKEN